jgi:hypothetical protein
MNKTISEVDQSKCQRINLEQLAEPGGTVETVKLPFHSRLRLVLRRSFSPSVKRKLKKDFDYLAILFSRLTRNSETPSTDLTDMTPIKFNPGDKVLVKSKDKIQVTLNYWNELKGCSFLPEMWQYCGTIQRVLKPVQRFVDERDCRVKKVKGVYLLEGVICQGFELYGGCDRACFYFWREEWLEELIE